MCCPRRIDRPAKHGTKQVGVVEGRGHQRHGVTTIVHVVRILIRVRHVGQHVPRAILDQQFRVQCRDRVIDWEQGRLEILGIARGHPIVPHLESNVPIDVILVVPARTRSRAVAVPATGPGEDGRILRKVSLFFRRIADRVHVCFGLLIQCRPIIRYAATGKGICRHQSGLHPDLCVPEDLSCV